MPVLKGNLKKKYELLDKEHKKLLAEMVTASTLILNLQKKVREYEALLNAGENDIRRVITDQKATLDKIKKLVAVKDETITQRNAEIEALKDEIASLKKLIP